MKIIKTDIDASVCCDLCNEVTANYIEFCPVCNESYMLLVENDILSNELESIHCETCKTKFTRIDKSINWYDWGNTEFEY